MLERDNSGRFFTQTNSEANADFVSRQKNVFGDLDALVGESEKNVGNQHSLKRNLSTSEERKLRKKQKSDMREFRGQESIFKRPEAPPPSRFMKNIPDFKKNPTKWTKYTLSDVSPDDMSEQSNTAAAMSFLRELKAKKEEEAMEMDSDTKPITFKKPSKYQTQKSCLEEKEEVNLQSTTFRSSKVVMPEYVVGEKRKQKKSVPKPTLGKVDKSKEIKLGHLLDEDEED